MQHNLEDFLRHGGNGRYVMAQRRGQTVGRRLGISRKSAFPNYAALRAAFSDRLDRVVAENTRMLLNALTPPDTVPTVSEADLRDVSDAKTEALDAWDAQLGIIFNDYQNHPQRLRPLRMAMEERLVRAFAGLINQLRQEDIGIEQYTWRSQDDSKVRASHVAYDDRRFRWDDPPEGGHPGQAHNCRCYAEPIVPGAQSPVILADFAPTAGGFPALDPSDVIGGLRALTGVGAALLTSEVLQDWTDVMRDQRVADAGVRLGVDLTTVEGRLAATAYALVQEGISSGGYPVLPKTPEFARIGAEAAALFELMHPGTILETGVGGDPAKQRALQDFIAATGEAFERGNLRLQDGELAQGWVEVFPELTDDEIGLGQLPGFTPERIEQWLETYPIEELGLPNHTGSPIPDDPIDSIISTPIPEEAEPNIVASERSQEEFDALARDPARGGIINEKTKQERKIGLGAEGAGLVAGPIVRYPTGAAEFIDADGQAWDVKGFRSDFPASAGGFDVEKDVAKVERELAAGHNVIIDTENLSEADLEALRNEIERRGISDRVVYWP